MADRLDALARDEAGERLRIDPEHVADAHGVEPAVVDQPPDRLRMDAERVGDLAHAVQILAHFVQLGTALALAHGPDGPLERLPFLLVRRTVLLLALCLPLAACGSAASTVGVPTQTTPSNRLAGGAIEPPDRAQPIALHDAHGRTITLAGQRGRWTLVTFLYTHCPDVCPLIASNLNTVLRVRGPNAKLSVLAVSVDPKGDTPANVRAYERRMHLEPNFHFLIGTRAQLRPVWAAWHVLAVQSKPNLVDHVAYTALVDPQGRRRVLYDSQVQAQHVLHDLHVLERRAA